MSTPLHIGLLIFPKVTQLDFTGPLQVFARVPGATVHLIWKRIEPVPSDSVLVLTPTVTFADCPQLDVICVPGGAGTDDLVNDTETLDFLRSYGLPYVVVDMPQGHASSVPPVVAATTSDLAVVRFHGHSDKWNSRDIYERFGYLYSEEELEPWAPRLRELATQARETHVLLNNCYRNYAQTNARQLAALVSDG